MEKSGRNDLFDLYAIKVERRSDGRLELWEGGFLGRVLGDTGDELLAKLLKEQAEQLQDINDRLRVVDALFVHDAVTQQAEVVGEVSLEQVARLIRGITGDLDSHPGFVERLAGFIAAGGLQDGLTTTRDAEVTR
ncbi:MAG TPA: hypothetical protein VK698_22660 [Kofleriaceae bacterium]|nr:hypothetical protein [Kofleriaceae bacterium]